jgi:GGDEF domain-containing protein
VQKPFQRYEEFLASIDRRLAARLRALFQAVAVYAALLVLLTGAHIAGVSTLAAPWSWLLPGGISVMNVLVVWLACHPGTAGWTRSRLLTAQAATAIAAASVYTVTHRGGPELPAFLYLVAVLAAAPRIGVATLRGLSAAACGAFALALACGFDRSTSVAAAGHSIAAVAMLAACLALMGIYAKRVSRRQLQAHVAVARLQSTIRVLSARSDREIWQRSFRREHVSAILEKEKARADRTGRSFSVCMLDRSDMNLLDEKSDERGGLSIGSLSDRAARILRATDTVCRTRYRRSLGRSGAEEFLAVLPETRLAHARICAERLTRLGVTGLAASRPSAAALVAGIAEYEPGETIATMLRRADQALRAAQGSGAGAIKGGLSRGHVGRPPPKPRLRVVR